MSVAKIIVGAAALLAVTAAALFLSGMVGGSEVTHPPCTQLPTAAQAVAALTTNQALAAEFRALGDGITVEAHNPCPGQNRGLIRITYRSGPERDAVTSLVNSRAGFGVPLYVVER